MINRYIELRSESPDVITGTVLRYGDLAHIGRTFHERFMPRSLGFFDERNEALKQSWKKRKEIPYDPEAPF